MKTVTIGVQNSNRETHSTVIDVFPDTCPSCRRGIEPIFFIAYGDEVRKHSGGVVQAIFRCPKHDCNKLFIAYYLSESNMDTKHAMGLLRSGLPIYCDKVVFDEIISNISKSFPVIYNEALTSEKNGLMEICGAGYRKALEFLVKDYLIHEHPSKHKEITNEMPLSKTIGRINDPNIETCAKRAYWLGNDETHYTRKFTDADLSHLKELIDLVVYWIASSEKTKKYKAKMPDKK